MSKFNSHLKEHCKPMLVEEIKEKMDEESVKDFYSALKDERVSSPTIVKVLSEFGITTSKSVIARWRNGHEPDGLKGKKKIS